jgi:hypothetical protein
MADFGDDDDDLADDGVGAAEEVAPPTRTITRDPRDPNRRFCPQVRGRARGEEVEDLSLVKAP